MESTFTSIGILTVIAFVVILYFSNLDKKEQDTKYFEKFLDRGDELERFRSFFYKNKNLSRNQALRKFYSDTENYNRAQKLMDDHKQWEKEIDDKNKKKYTIKRVYSYQYEDFVYSLFSPLASYHEFNHSAMVLGSLPHDYIVHKLADYQKISLEKASDLLKEFVENELVSGEMMEILCNDRSSRNKKYKNYEIGLTLTMYANVVNDSDMNMGKWIETNGKSMSEEELEKELAKY